MLDHVALKRPARLRSPASDQLRRQRRQERREGRDEDLGVSAMTMPQKMLTTLAKSTYSAPPAAAASPAAA
ncbi:MAG: hypothetical protein OXF93_11700 [Acidobacteria bacterium]|nr:hypothetical protein [Acidobacteriota bacterium]